MKPNWDEIYADTENKYRKAKSKIEEILRSPTIEIFWEYDLDLDNYPPEVVLSLYARPADDERRKEIYKKGDSYRSLNEKEKKEAGTIAARLSEACGFPVCFRRSKKEQWICQYIFRLNFDDYKGGEERYYEEYSDE